MAKQSFSVGQVLTAAQMTSLQQTAMLGGAPSAKTTSYTLVAADAGTSISMTSTSATTITVNTGLFSAGDTVQITNLGSGICTITAGTATVNTSASLALAQYESGTLVFTSASASIFIKGAGAAAASGGMTLISETVASANSSLSLSSIPGTYKQLMLIWSGIYHSTTGSNFVIRFNNSSSTYWGSGLGAAGTATSGAFGYNETSITKNFGGLDISPFGTSANFSTTDTNAQANGYLLIDDYTSTTKYKHFETSYGFYQNAATTYVSLKLNAANSDTAAITSIDVIRASGSATFTNRTNTSIRLYGIS